MPLYTEPPDMQDCVQRFLVSAFVKQGDGTGCNIYPHLPGITVHSGWVGVGGFSNTSNDVQMSTARE